MFILERVIRYKSAEILASWWHLCFKSGPNIHYTIRISLILRTIENIKIYNVKISCNCEIMNKLFYQKNDFIHVFFCNIGPFCCLRNCVLLKREQK